MDKVRAKFQVSSVKSVSWSPDMKVIELNAVSAEGVPENERFHKYTPSGNLTISIDNPPAAEFFKLGAFVYLDFTPAS